MAGQALHFLHGARIQRVDVPRPGLVCLTLYGGGSRQHLVAPFDGHGLPALVSERPRGDIAGGLAQKLRKRLVGARLGKASWRGTGARPEALLLPVEGAQPGALCVVLSPRCANLVCLDAAGRAIVTADAARLQSCGGRLGKPWAAPPEAPNAPFPDAPQAWRAAATVPTEAPARTADEQRRMAALREARKRLRRAERKVAAIEADLARAERAAPLRSQAQWLLSHLNAVPRGAREVSLPDPEGGEAPLRLTLDPALSPLANAERWFSQARRFERGRPIATERLERAREQRDALAGRVEHLSQPGADPAALGDPSTAPQPEAPRPPSRGKGEATPRRPFRSFASEGDFRVLVGRSAADNDTLTLRHARPGDLWLHVRDSPGAHVVVPLERGRDCPDRVRLDAALLAAHFSPQAREAQVDVSVCERRHVRKRRGSPPGTVQLDREKVLLLRGDPERVRWLLERELPR